MGQTIIARRGGGGDSSAFEVKGYFTRDDSYTYNYLMVLYFKPVYAAEFCVNVASNGDTSSLVVWAGTMSGNAAIGATFPVSGGATHSDRVTGQIKVSRENGYCYLHFLFFPYSTNT